MIFGRSVLLIAFCIFNVPFYIHCKKPKKVISADVVKKINEDPESTWKAVTYGIEELDLEQFRRTKLGVKLEPRTEKTLTKKEMLELAKSKPEDEEDLPELPESFTWMDEKNTKCPIKHIRDQANCGSCWAISTASVIGDRFCIQSKGKINPLLSHEFFISCDKNNDGCDGAYMLLANNFTQSVGLITGGEYESDEGCQMYTIKPCGGPLKMPCTFYSAITPKCKNRKCNNEYYEYENEPDKNVYKVNTWWFINGNKTHSAEYIAKYEILNNGPITAAFYVQTDLYYYKSGVYIPDLYDWYVGGHAVRVVGWGVENGIPYWQVANSWGADWGEEGFFKIIRGVNACFFEDMFTILNPLME